jgi:hypothetical protein
VRSQKTSKPHPNNTGEKESASIPPNIIFQDAKEYYVPKEVSPRKKKLKQQDSMIINDELKAECYIGF